MQPPPPPPAASRSHKKRYPAPLTAAAAAGVSSRAPLPLGISRDALGFETQLPPGRARSRSSDATRETAATAGSGAAPQPHAHGTRHSSRLGASGYSLQREQAHIYAPRPQQQPQPQQQQPAVASPSKPHRPKRIRDDDEEVQVAAPEPAPSPPALPPPPPPQPTASHPPPPAAPPKEVINLLGDDVVLPRPPQPVRALSAQLQRVMPALPPPLTFAPLKSTQLQPYIPVRTAMAPPLTPGSATSDEAGTYEEVVALEACHVEDRGALTAAAQRLQQLAQRVEKHTPSAGGSADSETHRAAAKRLWKWSIEHREQLDSCLDVLAAVRVSACGLLSASYLHRQTASGAMQPLSVGELETQLQLYIDAANVAAKASESSGASSAPSALLSSIDVGQLYNVASATLKLFKSHSEDCPAALHWRVHEGCAAWAYANGALDSCFEHYREAYLELFMRQNEARPDLVATFHKLLHKKALEITKRSPDAPVAAAQQAVKFLTLSTQVLDMCKSIPKWSSHQWSSHHSLSVLFLDTLANPISALVEAEKALGFQPDQVESLQVCTRALFASYQWERARESLRRTLLHNSCSKEEALELVEKCCEKLPVDTANGDSEREANIATMHEAFDTMAGRWRPSDQTLLSQFRLLTHHHLYSHALTHLDRILSLPELDAAMVKGLHETTWRVIVELFERKDYAATMAWLQRYADKFHHMGVEPAMKVRRAMAISALEMQDAATASTLAEEARALRLSDDGDGQWDGISTALLARAAAEAKDWPRAEAELQQLAQHADQLGPEVCTPLIAIVVAAQSRDEAAATLLRVVPLMLQLLASGRTPEGFPFTRVALLRHAVRTCKEQRDRLQRTPGQRATVASQEEERKSGDPAVPMDVDGAASTAQLNTSCVAWLELAMTDYMEQLLDAIHAMSVEERQPADLLSEKEVAWFGVTAWNAARACAAESRAELSARYFLSAARMYELLGIDSQQRVIAGVARYGCAMELLEHAASVEQEAAVVNNIASEALKQLSAAESVLRPVDESHASHELFASFGPPDRLLHFAMPMLQLKAQLMQQRAEAEIQQWLDQLHADPQRAAQWTSADWITAAGMTLHFRQRRACSDCMHRALLGVDADDLLKASQVWRELLASTPEDQLLAEGEQLQKWLEKESGKGGAALSRRYPLVESKWLLNHFWNVGVAHNRAREPSIAAKFMSRALAIYLVLIGPRESNKQAEAMKKAIDFLQQTPTAAQK